MKAATNKSLALEDGIRAGGKYEISLFIICLRGVCGILPRAMAVFRSLRNGLWHNRQHEYFVTVFAGK